MNDQEFNKRAHEVQCLAEAMVAAFLPSFMERRTVDEALVLSVFVNTILGIASLTNFEMDPHRLVKRMLDGMADVMGSANRGQTVGNEIALKAVQLARNVARVMGEVQDGTDHSGDISH